MPATIDLEGLGLDAGGHLLVERALAHLAPGDRLVVRGRHPTLRLHLAAWCRAEGHRLDQEATAPTVVRGSADLDRWRDARRAGRNAADVAPHASPAWGLAARGALVEPGGPPLSVDWVDRDLVWADIAPQLYAQATANQWDPATAVDWAARGPVPDDVEDAVVQVMTYLVENEQAALMIPARLLSRLHPHYREVMQLLAAQAADEARHVEIFTRRALLHRDVLGLSGAGGRASLQTLLEEPDFTLASFLLSVLGEGSFLDLLHFLHRHAPDGVTADVTRLAARDEARHVAFGVAHTAHVVRADPGFLSRLRTAVERRHAALADTAGLNKQVFDALVILAAGSWEPAAIARGWQEVLRLQETMDSGRRRRLEYIGFPADEAAALSALHTRNFM
ncbi:ferritin-like domain-containing protein [Micromonospora costi]|uniref:Ferritin-like domain-containing protein n=1 Tax=Micromonospora costi TaxID=1530042 RepID=A0A3A9ZPR4_9ACTN|nr:ferritin-like domain-containing protein [Micromonospora costi]RKN50163.1 ferritin-like domain-containing protein [Micromonospora costi]